MNLSEEQILALAPDEASRKSGRELANASKWSNTALDEKALWGECQGSGKNPYRTQVDLRSIAFKCSCPSRKFPCKHGLGMLLLYARQKELFAAKAAPGWVSEWIDKREEKQEKKQEKEEKPVDAEAQAKRQAQRLKKIDGGVDELQLAIKDIVRNGILNMPEKGQNLFTNLTKRMVDAQAQGLAIMTRELAELNYYKEGWQSEFMDQLARIYLVISAFKNSGVLPEELLQEVRGQVGFTQSTEELKQQQGVKDQWLVLGKQTEQQEQLFVQRNWLLGTATSKYALVLQFYVRAQPPELNLTPGTLVEAELSFFRSINPLRAMVKTVGGIQPAPLVKGFENWRELIRFEQELCARSPFTMELPFLINSVTLAGEGQTWFLNDPENNPMPISCDPDKLYRMLAVSGGQSFSAALTGGEGVYQPIGMFMNQQFVIL